MSSPVAEKCTVSTVGVGSGVGSGVAVGSWLCRHIHDCGLRIDRGQGHSLIADAQQRADNYAADAQCDDRAGGKVVAVHSHISLPRSRSVIV